MIQPISDSTVTEKVYEALRREITKNEYQPNTRLLLENLAKELQVSLTPVREALGRLNSEGFVETQAQGFYVSPITINNVKRMFEVRNLVEPYLARQAAEQLDNNTAMTNKLQMIKRTIERVDKETQSTQISDSLVYRIPRY